MSRILGIDPGQARIGIAIADEHEAIAFPRETVSAARTPAETASRIAKALGDEEVSTIVVGLPLSLDGKEGEAARRARRLGEAIRGAFEVEVRYWDERMTTLAAERSLREIGVQGPRGREVVDQSAAAIMLQGYLDATKSE